MHDNYHLDVEKTFRCEDSSLIHIPILFKWIVMDVQFVRANRAYSLQ